MVAATNGTRLPVRWKPDEIANSVLVTALLWLPVAPQTPLPGTGALTGQSDFAAQMVDGINEYLLRLTSESPGKRSALWNRDYTSIGNYERSISPTWSITPSSLMERTAIEFFDAPIPSMAKARPSF